VVGRGRAGRASPRLLARGGVAGVGRRSGVGSVGSSIALSLQGYGAATGAGARMGSGAATAGRSSWMGPPYGGGGGAPHTGAWGRRRTARVTGGWPASGKTAVAAVCPGGPRAAPAAARAVEREG